MGVPSSIFLGTSKSQRFSEERHLSQHPREGRRPDLPPGCEAEAERGQGKAAEITDPRLRSEMHVGEKRGPREPRGPSHKFHPVPSMEQKLFFPRLE